MARPLRIEYPGAFHHVMSRGNDGTPIVRDDTDRKKFLELLVRAIGRFGWILHDWVLMTNHLHFSIETPECTLSDGMHWLLGTCLSGLRRRSGSVAADRPGTWRVQCRRHLQSCRSLRSELADDGDLCELLEACRGRMKRRPPPFFPIQTPHLTARRYHRAPTRGRR